jgi:glycosyltransferase involved in cell wall biosynthesis
MRILHSCLRYPPATGGVETYVEEIVKRTINIAEKRDVRVLTSKMRTHGPISELDPESLLDDPIYVQRLHHMNTPLISYPRLQALKYYTEHHKPDIVHGYSFWYQPADVTARYAHKNNIPFIFHPIYYENDIRQKPLWQLYKKTIGKKTFAAADVTVVISPHEQELITKANFPVKRFELIPPGIDTNEFETPRQNPFLKQGIKGNVLLAVGRISAGKGLDDVISVLSDILKQKPDTSFVIIGEDFGEKDNLSKQAKQLGVEKNVIFLNKVSKDKLTAAYPHADIFIHPSHYEAFGIVLAEAQAANTPVIARNTAAIPFVVPHEKGGLLFTNQTELKKSLLLLLNNTDLRKTYGQQGSQYVSRNFNWDNSIKKLINLYQELRPN